MQSSHQFSNKGQQIAGEPPESDIDNFNNQYASIVAAIAT